LFGCNTLTHGGASASADFNRKMRQVELGMSKVQLGSVFDEAAPRGAKKYPNGTVEVLEVKLRYYAPFDQKADRLSGYVEEPPTWFYFYNGKLVQYGLPNDWPKDPDKIIEVRVR
jgi:hypothetical protein